MEKPNVNNLNGIPNFGHGFPEEIEETEVVIPTESETPAIDEDSSSTETEVKEKKHVKRKSKD